MSGLLAGKVWQSDLASHLKPVAAAMADIANDDGTSIYPSVEYLAWLLSRKERSVQVALAELRELGVIVPVANLLGGRGNPVEYNLIEEKLPKRISWRELREQKKGVENAPFRNGAVGDDKGCSQRQKRVQLDAPDPSRNKKQPLVLEPPFGGTAFNEALAAFDRVQRENRRSQKPTQRERMFANLKKWGEADAVIALNTAADNGWRTAFPPKNRSQYETTKNNSAGERSNGARGNGDEYDPFAGKPVF